MPPVTPVSGTGTFFARLDRATLATAGVVTIAAIAAVAALDYGSAIAIPTVLAALAAIALAPLVRLLEQAYVPSSIAAGLIVLGTLCATGATLYALAPSADAWRHRAPDVLRTIEWRARAITTGFARTVGADPAPVAAGSGDEDDQDALGKLVEGGERLVTDLAISAPRVVGGAVYWAALTFFMLRDRAVLARGVLALGFAASTRRALGRAMRDVQADVSRYLFTITLVNIGLGVCVAAAFGALGVPNAALWGVAAGLLNFMPIVGAAAMTLVTLGVGIVSFDDPATAFAPVVVIVALNTLEGHLITPMLIGARMRLSAIGVFVAIAFGAWLWGAAGALIATPSLIVSGAFLTRLDRARSRPTRRSQGSDRYRGEAVTGSNPVAADTVAQG